MKKLLFILFLIPAISKAQTFYHVNGNQGWDVMHYRHFWTVGTDTIAYAQSGRFRFLKPAYLGVWTTAGRPSPAVAGYFGYNSDSARIEWYTGSAWAQSGNAVPSANHSTLSGLSADDHTQYAMLAGRSGGQSLTGGTASGDDLTLLSTSNGTKGNLFFGTAATYDQVNDRWGFSTTAPTHAVTLGSVAGLNGIALYKTSDQVTNYGRHVIYQTPSGGNPQLIFDAQAGGTVTANGYSFRISNVSKLDMDGSNAIWAIGNLAAADATYDLSGRVSASPLRFRNAYLSGGIQLGAPANTSMGAKVHIGAGTATANTAPIKLTSGTALTTPEDGAMEYHSSHLYFTIGSTRYQLDQQSSDGNGIYSGSGSLPGSVNVTGGGANALNLGTTGSKLTNFAVNTSLVTTLSAGTYVQLFGGVQFSAQTGTDANFTAADNASYITLPAITAGRNFTLPSQGSGKYYIIHNKNASGNAWNVVGNLVDAAGATISTIPNSAFTIIISDGTNFIKMN